MFTAFQGEMSRITVRHILYTHACLGAVVTAPLVRVITKDETLAFRAVATLPRAANVLSRS